MALPVTPSVDFDSWLDLESKTRVRHELVGGQLFAMTGGTLDHSLVAANFVATVHGAAREQGCRTYQSDAALRVGENGYYPDAMVVCEPRSDERFERSPCLVIEVLSPSTATTDRREKLDAYKSIPALQTYLIADPERRLLHVHRREGTSWFAQTLGAGDVASLDCPRLDLAVDDLFADLG